MNRKYQEGGIVSFVVVGLVLVLVAMAALYFVRHNGADQSSVPIFAENTDDSRDPGAQEGRSQQSTDSKNTEAKKDDKKPSSDAENKPKNDVDKSKNQSTGDSGSGSGDAKNGQSTPGSNAAPSDSKGSNLPTTGPEDTIGSVVAASSLTALAVAYYRSRQLV